MRVAFSGWENTGKTTLSKWLSESIEFTYLREYARDMLPLLEYIPQIDWNKQILEIYKLVYFSTYNTDYVADRSILDVFSYLYTVSLEEDSLDYSLTNVLVKINVLRYPYDVIICLDTELDIPEGKKHVPFTSKQKENFLSIREMYLDTYKDNDTKILRITTNSLEDRKRIIYEFLTGLRLNSGDPIKFKFQ